jgi:uncharacterized integral membrane protein
MIIYLVVVGLMIIFASQNLDLVTVYLVAGKPIQVPLVVIIGMSFFAGIVFAILTVIRKAMRGKNKNAQGTFMEPGRDM